MDSEFPDPDEEYDLLHQDEFELLREIEEVEQKKQQPADEDSNILQEKTSEASQVKLNNLPVPESTVSGKDLSKKRSYHELFGDITDVLEDFDSAGIYEPLEKKPRWNQPQEIIRALLEARDKFKEETTGVPGKGKQCAKPKDSLSLRVPPWNFVAVTTLHESQRVYVRVSNNRYKVEHGSHVISNLLSVPFRELKDQAEEIMIKNAERVSQQSSNSLANKKIINNDELWVDKYRPRSYIELLSDESVNRHLLHWIKLWDKVVFNKTYDPHQRKKQQSIGQFPYGKNKFENAETVQEVDSKGFPIQRVVLLSGPPGLGKTTLAHLVAKHAGYNVVEINASDERTPDAFRQVLLASTEMRAVMGNDPRPNCLVLDEIDGAPAPSIDLLLKFVQGKLTAKGKKDKGKSDKEKTTCHRPVICICNEPYTPSLRSLRAVALTIPVPDVNPARLADRLMEISRKEKLKVNSDALLKLAEVSGCDIRSCLGALQYMGGVQLGDNLSFALKDSRKGLFDSWKQILSVPMNRAGLLPTPQRVSTILRTVQNGESEKLAQGIFHNYPEICSEKLQRVSAALEWFQFFDEVTRTIASLQAWSVMPYTNYAFVSWNLYLAKTRNAKLSYPSIAYEVNQRRARSTGILTTIQRSSGRDIFTLAVDIAPYMPDILSPRLRTVSGHLLAEKEREEVARLIDIMLEFGLSFAQEKTLEGSYDYILDPNIFEIGIFPECKPRRMLAYAAKQIVTRELVAERLRRAANLTGITPEEKNGTLESVKRKSKTPVAEKSAEVIRKELGTTRCKDFFGRLVAVNRDKSRESKENSTGIPDFFKKPSVWYKYKEGFSNAVRRNVYIQDIV